MSQWKFKISVGGGGGGGGLDDDYVSVYLCAYAILLCICDTEYISYSASTMHANR